MSTAPTVAASVSRRVPGTSWAINGCLSNKRISNSCFFSCISFWTAFVSCSLLVLNTVILLLLLPFSQSTRLPLSYLFSCPAPISESVSERVCLTAHSMLSHPLELLQSALVTPSSPPQTLSTPLGPIIDLFYICPQVTEGTCRNL